MAASREVEQWDRFNGGLNLTKQTSSLDRTETPDCLNMDFGLRGGFMLRGGFRAQVNNALLVDAKIIGVAELATSKVLIQSAAGDLVSWDGSTLADTTANVTDTTDRVRMTSFNDNAYLANGRSGGDIIMQKWTGAARSTLGTAWNNDYLVPTTGNMPLARHIASHAGFVFVADTVESSVRYPTRVRFSHEQFPESWAQADYFDVGAPGVNDPITALVPFADQLLVFKKSSVWRVLGYDRDTFILEQVADATGICTCGSHAVNAGVCYWFSTDGKLMSYNGQGVRALSEKLDWWSELGKIKHGGAHRLMWSDGRLYMSLEAGSGQPVSRWLFVWDPASKSFTRYSPVVSELVHWSKIGADGDPIFLVPGSQDLLRYDRTYESDLFGGVETRIDGYYRTAWMTAGETATRKRWKRPRVTAAAAAMATIKVEVFLDFDDLSPRRFSQFTIDVPVDASLWGTMEWGDDWYVAADDYYEFERIGSSGTGFSVSFKFSSPDNLGRWWVDSIAVPFRRKSVK
jgi:hypothetical protein